WYPYPQTTRPAPPPPPHSPTPNSERPQLGIRRQTLYNRLDKVTQMVGVDYNDKPNWVMLLFAAKLTKSWQEQHGE
ncbi:helix-turn-helix domain-containing protein, partial [Bifidobacterium longum]|uniref:helix-turn-helix domain-containing protein n=1 Tax=Bifidobacterium longum TaxID=216816 RepID=UPI0032C0C3F6